jgi:hypothetical protein
VNAGGMTLCSGAKRAVVGSVIITVTDKNCISVIVKGEILMTVVLVYIAPLDDESRVVVNAGQLMISG